MSLNAALSIAGSGLAAINAQLALISHNVANASTPGYATEVAAEQSASAGGIGFGVISGPAQRQIDQVLQTEVLAQNAVTSGLGTRSAALQAIDTVQGTPGQGQDIASLLGKVQDAFSTLLNDPSNATQQVSVAAAAGTLARAINTLSEAYTTQRQNAQDAIVAGVGTLNTTLGAIGALSNKIVSAKALGQSTADLENQRDAKIAGVSQLVGVDVLHQANGDILLTTATGVTLPIHGPANPIATGDASAQPGAFYPGGGIPAISVGGMDVTAAFAGGSIGADITLRDTTFPTYQAGLDEFAQNLAANFAGQGLPLFTTAGGTVPSSAVIPAQAGYVGFAAQILVNPAITANPAAVRDGLPSQNTGAAAGFPDIISGILDDALGNAPLIGTHTAGLGPNGNLNAPYASPATLAGFATALVGTQAADSATTSTQLATEQAVQATLQGKLSTETGVNMDTEMSNMIALQNAYGANAKIIGAVQSMFAALLGMVNA
jgi:flagellar hook-associated protein 1